MADSQTEANDSFSSRRYWPSRLAAAVFAAISVLAWAALAGEVLSQEVRDVEEETETLQEPERRPPVRLVPPQEPSPVPRETEPLPAPRRSIAGSRTEVDVDRLHAIDPDSVGVLSEDKGGFGTEMWAGTPRSLVERLMPHLPAAARSREMRSLMRRLLLSTATAPAGPATAHSLVSLRVERLAAMGDIDSVNKLLKVAPVQFTDEALLRAQVDSLLLVNDSAGACPHVRTAIREFRGRYWQEVLIFCQALSGEHPRAMMGLDLMREHGLDSYSVFYKLAAFLIEEWRGEIFSLSEPKAVELAMMRAANLRLPADVVMTEKPAILRAIAGSPNADLEVRLGAAERAEAAGVFSAQALRQIYASVEFTPEEIGNALTLAESEGGPRARALLLRAARMQEVPTAKAEALLTLLGLAREKGLYGTVARASLPILMDITPSAELVWFAEEAGRALFLTGNAGQAMDWYKLAEREAYGVDEASRARARLWPLAQLADKEDTLQWDASMLAAWLAAPSEPVIRPQEEDEAVAAWEEEEKEEELFAASPEAGAAAAMAPAGPSRYQASVLLSLFDALGEPIDINEWDSLVRETPLKEDPSLSGLSIPPAALWYGLRTATEDLRLGESVLMALLCLGEEGLNRVHPFTLNEIVRGLRLIGLEDEVRALAVEAAIAAGL